LSVTDCESVVSEIDRRLIEKEQRRQRAGAERVEAAEAEIRMMVERIPAEAQAARRCWSSAGTTPGLSLRPSIDRLNGLPPYPWVN
jgi:hypothetical protein